MHGKFGANQEVFNEFAILCVTEVFLSNLKCITHFTATSAVIKKYGLENEQKQEKFQ